ncbi:peroxisomal membrane protein PEX30 [Nannizzia gypsea CBS 118893]|uniref:Peroxisomal membrane protein PEX30 n=1 Tax=Arthroderma gypseum (strain ATCC MYA-4604 / CBS 118893) TaxID=535722 RepID=E5R1Q9_ARTGP|nr:peroxisomal membrane protein PEX30 [Nannizzia gypsea CBS 118893]EFQ97757.1 peroxisomal membrane protein PEX30 [Nannizzia gypsea CBS 118893]
MSADPHSQNDGASGTLGSNDGLPPTVATFSPTNISGNSLTSKQRSTIIVHRKSPLLVATPPAVTRALAYSHPFLLPLNRLAGLLSWTSGDPWESFLLVGAFWAVTLHGSAIILWGGPILVVVALMLGLYSRRYSPLSSTGLTGEKHRRDGSDGSTRPHKTLDEIVETLREFTTRCNILLEPLRDLTDFLSTQRTATSTTTRPALTALLTRIILITPVWILLTLHPIYLITIKRVVITVGTIILTWHSKPARIFRVLLWRSLTIRHICSTITGLQLTSPPNNNNNDQQSSSFTKSSLLSLTPFRSKQQSQHGSTKRRASSSGVRFTFIVYENQRRWLGIGWTYSLFAYERPAWSDEHLNPVPPKDEFELPEVQGSNSKWRWVEGSEWRIDNSPDPSAKKKGKGSKNNDNKDDSGWIYYDNKWHDGRRGQDGWGRYTRRRKWCRDAELVEISPDGDITGTPSKTATENESKHNGDCGKDNNSGDDKNSTKARKRRWFGSADLKGFSAVGSEPSSSTQPINAEPISTSPTTTGSSLPKALSVSSGRSSNNNNGSIRTRNKRPSSIYTEGDRKSQTSSIRDREIEEAENMPDKWGSQSGNAAERAGRGWGLGDDAHMSLS